MKAILLAAALAHAQFGVKFIGEGGGSNPTPDSNNALETAAGGPAASQMAIVERVAAPKRKDPEEKSLTRTPKPAVSSKQFDGDVERPELKEPEPAARLFDQAPPPEPAQDVATVAGPQAGDVFVALDVDLAGRPDRDAVADLARAASFRPDGRFPPQLRGKDQVLVWGWMPPGKIAQAFQVRGVSRVQMDPPRLQPPVDGARGTAVVTVRLGPGQDPRSAAAMLERDVPGVKAAEPKVENGFAVLEVEVPLRLLPRLMAHTSVVKTDAPRPAPPILASAIPAPEGGFLKFAAGRAPILLIVTLLLLLPPVARGVGRLAQIFIPYQK